MPSSYLDSAELSPNGQLPTTPIAVIGMSCRLPGGIESPEQLWDALLRGDDLVTEVPADRWDMDQYYDPEPGVPGRSISKWAAFLDDPTGFDAEFFGIGDREALASDPQHRVLLETSWEAMEHAGLHSGSDRRDFDRRVCRLDALRLLVPGRRRGRHWRGLTDSPEPTSAWAPGESRTRWACTGRRSRWTPPARRVFSRFIWPVAVCTTGRAISPWRPAPR